MFDKLFVNLEKGKKEGKVRNTFQFVWFEKFYVVAEVAFVVGNPCFYMAVSG